MGGSYTVWNASGPDKTCNSCHEINPSYDTWAASAHRDVKCEFCHGTAMILPWNSHEQRNAQSDRKVRHVILALQNNCKI